MEEVPGFFGIEEGAAKYLLSTLRREQPQSVSTVRQVFNCNSGLQPIGRWAATTVQVSLS